MQRISIVGDRLFEMNLISDGSKVFNRDFDNLSVPEPWRVRHAQCHARGSAGHDHCPFLERSSLTDKGDDFPHSKNQVVGVGLLPDDTID